MGKYLDIFGVGKLWNKVTLKIQSVVEETLASYILSFDSIKTEAQTAKEEAKYYYELTRDAINTLNPDVADALNYAQAIVKHGRAITKIAAQLKATYNDSGRTSADEYIPGLYFLPISKDDMQEIIDSEEEDPNTVYLVEE